MQRLIVSMLAGVVLVLGTSSVVHAQGAGGCSRGSCTAGASFVESQPVAAPSGGGQAASRPAPSTTGGTDAPSGGGAAPARGPAQTARVAAAGDFPGANPLCLMGPMCGVAETPAAADAPAAPAAPEPPPIDWLAVARTIANDAAASMDIRPIDIGIVPEPLPGRVGVVGLPTWMWVANPSPATIGPQNRVVNSGPVTVTLNGELTSVHFDMGDGTAGTLCSGPEAPYTPYFDAAGEAPSPTCGYKYQRSSLTEPDGKFHVTATSAWVVTWTATTPAGTTGGVIPQAPSSSVDIRMGENQVLVQPGG